MMPLMAATIGPGSNHIYQHSGTSERGWKLRDGWQLKEILGVQYLESGAYVMLVHVEATTDNDKQLVWPPIDDQCFGDISA